MIAVLLQKILQVNLLQGTCGVSRRQPKRQRAEDTPAASLPPLFVFGRFPLVASMRAGA